MKKNNENKILIRKKVNIKNIVLLSLFIFTSLFVGVIITFFGQKNSYVETELITAIITLFGFGLTTTVFTYQAFEKEDNSKVKNLLFSISKSLKLIFVLIILALLFDFLGNSKFDEVFINIKNINHDLISYLIDIIKYSSLSYALICLIDILNSFCVIICHSKTDDENV